MGSANYIIPPRMFSPSLGCHELCSDGVWLGLPWWWPPVSPIDDEGSWGSIQLMDSCRTIQDVGVVLPTLGGLAIYHHLYARMNGPPDLRLVEAPEGALGHSRKVALVLGSVKLGPGNGSLVRVWRGKPASWVFGFLERV